MALPITMQWTHLHLERNQIVVLDESFTQILRQTPLYLLTGDGKKINVLIKNIENAAIYFSLIFLPVLILLFIFLFLEQTVSYLNRLINSFTSVQ